MTPSVQNYIIPGIGEYEQRNAATALREFYALLFAHSAQPVVRSTGVLTDYNRMFMIPFDPPLVIDGVEYGVNFALTWTAPVSPVATPDRTQKYSIVSRPRAEQRGSYTYIHTGERRTTYVFALREHVDFEKICSEVIHPLAIAWDAAVAKIPFDELRERTISRHRKNMKLLSERESIQSLESDTSFQLPDSIVQLAESGVKRSRKETKRAHAAREKLYKELRVNCQDKIPTREELFVLFRTIQSYPGLSELIERFQRRNRTSDSITAEDIFEIHNQLLIGHVGNS